jgi:hypothetical protein
LGIESLGNNVKQDNGGGMPPVDPNITKDPVADIINDWIEIRNDMDADKDMIEEQLAVAYENTPDLARSYQANIVYIRFLQRLLLEWPLEFPTSELPPPPPTHFPVWFCGGPLGEETFMCKCLTETNDLEHCILLDLARDGISIGEDEIIPGSKCSELLQSYKSALECQLRILDKDNPTDEDWEEFAQCKKNADQNWSAYVLRGCFVVQVTP